MKQLFFIICLTSFLYAQYDAVVIVPVANIVGESLQDYYLQKDLKQVYDTIPLSWAGHHNDIYTCPRVGQLLFNERVIIKEERGQEVLIEVPHLFYETIDNNEKHHEFWTHISYLLSPHHSLEYIRHAIPPALSSKKFSKKNIITLMLPFYDTKTGKTYSAGTRFVQAPHNHTPQAFSVYIVQIDQQPIVLETHIPKSICAPVATTPASCIKNFVNLLHTWATMPQGVVPFVWGGASFIKFVHDKDFFKKTTTLSNGEIITYWHRNDNEIYAGFDASGLILRAAQICGIPYYFKNSITASKNLRPLHDGESIEAGDLLWLPGGILVLTDHDTVIGAFGYQFNLGKVAEIKIENMFSNVCTRDELYEYYLMQKPLLRIGNEQPITTYKILKTKSAWEI